LATAHAQILYCAKIRGNRVKILHSEIFCASLESFAGSPFPFEQWYTLFVASTFSWRFLGWSFVVKDHVTTNADVIIKGLHLSKTSHANTMRADDKNHRCINLLSCRKIESSAHTRS